MRVRHTYIFIGMDTFDLKLFLVENKLTENSRLSEIKAVPGSVGKQYYGIVNWLRVDNRVDKYDGHPMYIITNSKQKMVDQLNLSDPLIYPKYTLSDMGESYSDGKKMDAIINDDWAIVTDDVSVFNQLLNAIKRGGNGKEPKKFSPLSDSLEEIKVVPKLTISSDIGYILEEAGLNFGDGILGDVGSGGGGYYDFISDEISGYNLDQFNEDEFNNWYNSFSLNSFNSYTYYKEYNEVNEHGINYTIISQIPPGFYIVMDKGFAQIENNGDFTLYATPLLSNFNLEEYLPIFSLDRGGKVIKLISKEKVAEKLKQNIENPGTWGII